MTITLFESPLLGFESYEHEIIQPDNFDFTYSVDYRDLENYRDEIADLVDAYEKFEWPNDRDEFALIEADLTDLKEFLKSLDFALSEFSRDEQLLLECDFDDWAYDRFIECVDIPDHIETYLDKDKIVRDMSHDYGMTCGIGFPETNQRDFYIV